MTERPSATDYRNRGERDAAYWREIAGKLAGSLKEIMLIHTADAEDFYEGHPGEVAYPRAEKALAEYKAARINAEALR